MGSSVGSGRGDNCRCPGFRSGLFANTARLLWRGLAPLLYYLFLIHYSVGESFSVHLTVR